MASDICREICRVSEFCDARPDRRPRDSILAVVTRNRQCATPSKRCLLGLLEFLLLTVSGTAVVFAGLTFGAVLVSLPPRTGVASLVSDF